MKHDAVLAQSIADALSYLKQEGHDIPLDIQLKARQLGAIKAGGDISSIRAAYHDAITEALLTYLEGGSVTAPRNQFRQAAVEALGDAFELGYMDGGAELPIDSDPLSWLNARIEQEMAHIGTLFEQAKELRKEADTDLLGFASDRADGYTGTLDELYNMGKLYAAENQMLTFEGSDGKESCSDCSRYKGQRHRASWWIAHDAVPPSKSFECGGWNCEHVLVSDDGEEFTI